MEISRGNCFDSGIIMDYLTLFHCCLDCFRIVALFMVALCWIVDRWGL
jgi:hypothetical protein